MFLSQLASGLSTRPGGLQPDEEEKLNRVLLASDFQAPSARALQPSANNDANTRQILGHVQELYNAGASGVPFDDVITEVKNRMGRLPVFNAPSVQTLPTYNPPASTPARLPTWRSPQEQAIQNTVAKYGAPTYNSPASSPLQAEQPPAAVTAPPSPEPRLPDYFPQETRPKGSQATAAGVPVETKTTPPFVEPQTTQVTPKPQELPTWRTQEEQAKDASYTPPSERMDAVLKASGITPSTATSAPDPLAVRDNTSVRSNDELIAHVQRSYDELSALERSPIENKNSRWKGALKSFIRLLPGAMAAAASHADPAHPWGSLLGGLIAAAGGGVYGAVDKTFDERMDRQAEVEKRTRKLQRELIVAKSVADVQKILADAASKSAPGASDTRRRSALMRELQSRMKLTAGKYDPNDARQVEIASELNITPKDKPGGKGMNWQRIRNLRVADGTDRLVFLDFDEDGNIQPRYLSVEGDPGEPLSERDRKTLALQLERENRERGQDGLGPLRFNDTPPATAPPVTPAPSPASSSPPPAATSAAPVLVPTGEKPLPVKPRYHSRGGRGAGFSQRGGGSSSGDAKGASITLSRINSLSDQIAKAEAEGDDETANSLRQSRAAEQETARRLHSGAIQITNDGRAAWKGTGARGGQQTPRPKLKPPFDLTVPSH